MNKQPKSDKKPNFFKKLGFSSLGNPIPFVSVHGGHSGEFCNHAKDTLEEIIIAYIKKGFKWVGITDHIPPVSDRFLYQDEKEAGLDAQTMYARFRKYISTCRNLQKKYADAITIYVAFETETYSGYEAHIRKLIQEFKPDYIVGSVHHVDDIPFDYSPELYAQAAEASGGLDALYCRYFDQQYEMIHALKPEVVGHFDLIRLYDADYLSRLEKPEIQQRIQRNLESIKIFELILDFNLRALAKGAAEPYISKNILIRALKMGISVVPGDDSHGTDSVGLNIEKGISLLQQTGFNCGWRKPNCRFYT